MTDIGTHKEKEIEQSAPIHPSGHVKIYESSSYGAYMLRADATRRFFKQRSENSLVLMRTTALIPVNHQTKEEFTADGTEVYTIDGHIFGVHYARDKSNVKINYTGMPEILKELEEFVMKHNRLRGKLFQLIDANMNFEIIKTPEANIKDVIINEKLKKDIEENTIYELIEMKRSNAVLNWGPPGTGKTMISRALAKLAAENGIGTCFLVNYQPFQQILSLIKEFLMPCLLLLEDVDNYAGDREKAMTSDGRLSDLLSFLNGVDEENHQIVVVANTNHLEKLDAAVSARPMRFNRKYHINFPEDEQVDLLIDLYFGKDVISPEKKKKLHGKQYTGAHVEQIRRTADRTVKREGVQLADVFDQSVEMVFQHFKPVDVKTHVI